MKQLPASQDRSCEASRLRAKANPTEMREAPLLLPSGIYPFWNVNFFAFCSEVS
jgi:hypothetical protein